MKEAIFLIATITFLVGTFGAALLVNPDSSEPIKLTPLNTDVPTQEPLNQLTYTK